MAELGVWTIPGYVVHERLDAGLVSASYLASRSSDGYPVLLQVISEEFSDPASAAQFREATERVAALEHPVIPAIRDVGEVDGLLYVITSAVEGQPLGLTLARTGALSLDDALAACTELADALDTMAAEGIVHGAISPTTVWRNDRSRSPGAPHVSLRGFGNLPLRTGAVLDHPDAPPPADVLYTAPEQVHGAPVGVRTDQYALACMALHSLTGSPPFVRASTSALFDAHAYEDPDASLRRADWLPPQVAEGLRRGLSKDPGDRFESCTALATSIGGVSRRSWSWMLERGTTGTPVREIDIRDDPGAGEGAAPNGTPGTASGAPDPDRTAHALSEVDWMPSSATPGGQQPAVPLPRALRRRRRARSRRNSRGRGGAGSAGAAGAPGAASTAWRAGGVVVLLAALVVGALVIARTVLVARDDEGPATASADQPTGDSAPEVAASWREPVTEQPITSLAALDEELVGVSGATVLSVDMGTGRERWSTALDAPAQELTVLGPTAIVRTDDEFVGVSVADGGIAWRSSETDLPALESYVTGRGRMFGIGSGDDGQPVVHAIDPTTGEVGWTISAAAEGGDGDESGGNDAADALLAFDGSQEGQPSLYVTDGGRLIAVDAATRQRRWEVDLPDDQPTSLVALAGSILVVGGDGAVCRYDADGELVWTECAEIERDDVPAAITQIRDSQVIVSSPHEVVSIDYTSGTPSWRIVSDQALQDAIAGSPAATFIAAPDGTVEAIGQHNGATLWESAPFGAVTAMAATDSAVFVSTSDGRVARLEGPAAAG